MAGNRIQYEVGFTADTSQLKKSVQEAVSALNKVGTSSNSGLTSELKQASQSALELASNLKNATNADTGKLNLAQFNKSLASSKKTLTDYRVELSKLGPEGQQAFLKMALAIGQAELPMARAGKLLDSMYTTMKNTMKWQLSSSALNAFTGALSTAYNYSKDLNKSLNDIRIVSGQSVDQMKDFAREATSAAKELSTTTTAYTEGSLIYFQQGLSTEEVKERTDITIKMANAVGESTEKISDQLTAVWNNFADGTQTLEHYADAMVKLGAYTASSSDEIAQGTEKFAAVAKMIGLDFDNAAAALATVTAQTRQSADVVGTAFRTIFARMEGLKLGETLEDGTDLNQYSQALAKVGINIKDQNGQLKDMTLLIDEIGNRWQQISRDQQVALAQTVAGVRQYAQFAALFENFDYYQELVGVAKNSEGELSKQAQIYEESWKAASKRVKASAEEVYNAIINDQMFIDLDNSLTGILHVIAQIVEAAGGLKGLFNIAAFAALSLYGDKIAEGMRNMVGQAKILLGLETTRARVTQREAMEQAKLLPIYTGLSESEFASIEVMNKKIEIQNEINKVIDSYTDAQKEQVRQDQEHLNLLGEVYKAQTKNLEQLNDELAIQQNSKIKAAAGKDMGITDEKKLKSVRATYQNAKNYLSKAGVDSVSIESKDILSQGGTGTKSSKEVAKVAKGFQTMAKQIAMTKGNVIQFRKTYEQLNKEQQKSPKFVKELLKTYKLLDDNVKDNDLPKIIANLNKEADGAEAQIRVLSNALADMGVDNTGLEKIVEIIYKIQNNSIGADEALKQLLDLHSEMENKLQNGGYEPTKDLASAFTNVAQEISGIMMALQSWKSVLDVWSDDAASLGDKIAQSLTAVAMMAPVLIQNYTKVKNKFEEVFDTKDKIKKYTEELDKLKEAKKQLIPGEEAYVAIEKQEAIVDWELTKARAAANAVALAAVAAILILTAIYQAYQKQLEEEKKQLEEKAEKSKEIVDNAKQEAEANKELLSSMKEALKIYQINGDNKIELDNITQQLVEAYNIEGAALARLTGNYEDYNKVLENAQKKKNEENQELAQKNFEYAGALQDKIMANSRSWIGRETGNARNLDNILIYSGFDWKSNDDIKFMKDVKEKFASTSASWFPSFGGNINISLTNDLETLEGVQEAYDILNKEIEFAEKTYSSKELARMGTYKKMKADRDALAEDLQNYNIANVEAQKYFLQSQDLFHNINTMEEFENEVNLITQNLQENGIEVEQIDGIIQSLAEDSLNDIVEKLYLQYKIVKDIKEEYSNIFTNFRGQDNFQTNVIEVLEKSLPEGQEINYSVLGRIDWNLIGSDLNQEDILSAYTNESNKLILEQKTSELDTIAADAKNALSQLTEEMNAEQMKAMSNIMTWGENGVISYSEFLKLTFSEQRDYLQEIAGISYESLIGISGQYIEELEKSKEDAEKILSSLNQYGNEQDLDKMSINVQKWTRLQELVEGYNDLTSQSARENWLSTSGDEIKELYQQLTGVSNTAEDIVDKSVSQIKQQILSYGNFNIEMQTKIVTKAEAAQDAIEEAQNKIDEQKQKVVIYTQLQLESIESTFDTYNTLVQKIANGVTDGYDSAGNKIKKMTNEVRLAIRGLYPEFDKQLTLMEDGTFAVTESIYDEFFNLEHGKIALDTEATKTQLENQKTLLIEQRNKIDDQIEKIKNADKITEDITKDSNDLIKKSYALRTGYAEQHEEKVEVTDANMEKTGKDVINNIDQASQNKVKDASFRYSNFGLDMISMFSNLQNAALNFVDSIGGKIGTRIVQFFKFDSKERGSGSRVGNGGSLGSSEETAEDIFNRIKNNHINPDGTIDIEGLEKDVANQITQNEVNRLLNLEGLKNERQKLDDQISSIDTALSGLGSTLDDIANSGNKDGSQSLESISKAQKKELDSLVDNYANVNEQLERYEKLLERASELTENDFKVNKSKNLRAEAELYRQQEVKQGEKKLITVQEQEKVISDVKEKTGIEIKLDYDTRRISNWGEIQKALNVDYSAEQNNSYNTLKDSYDALEEKKKMIESMDKKSPAYSVAVEAYNTAAKTYNDLKEKWEKAANITIEQYEANKELLQKLENTTDTVVEATEAELEAYQNKRQKLVDAFLADFEYLNNEAENRKTMNDFVKNYYESFDDVFSYGNLIAKQSAKNAQTNLDTMNDMSRRYQEILKNTDMTNREKEDAIEELKQQMITNIEEFLASIDEMQEQILAIFDETQQRFEKITADIERRNSRIDSYQELLTLQGYDPTRSKEANKMYNQMTNTKINNLQNEYAVEKQSLDYWQQQRDEVNKKLASLNEVNDPNKQMRAQLKEQLETIEENYQNSQDKLLEITNQTLTEIKALYETNINKELNDLESKLTNGLGFDELQTQFDYNLEAEEQYLDMVNEEYAVKEYGRQLDKAINSAQNKYATEQYENLRDEMEQRRANGKLSQYDLDLMNSKLEVTKAQMALEEAQNAKSTVRLVRNSAGNWDYQFTADQNKIDEAQANYDKAVNDSYNLAKNYYKTNMQNLIALRKEWYEQYKAIMTDTSLSDKERTEATNRLNERMSDKYKYTMSEMKIAQSDMSEFGKATVNDYGNVFRGVTEGIDLSYKTFEKDFTNSTNTMKKIFNEYGMVLNSTANTMGGSLNTVKTEMNNLTTATNEWKLNTTTALDEICSQERINQISDLREQIQGLYTDLYKSGAVHFTIKTDFADTQEDNSKEREKDAEGNQTATDFVNNEKDARVEQKKKYWSSKGWTDKQINQAIDDYEVDLMAQMISILKNPNVPDGVIDDLNLLGRRNKKIAFWGLNEETFSNVRDLKKWAKEKYGFATGGYTGDFSGARLAFLHEKELVLNKTDTQNILSAVAAVRELAPALLEKIGQSLNGQILAGRSLMESRMSVYKPSFSAEAQPLEQNVIIQADFPGVSAAVEIEAALNNLINDATQYASVVRG